MAEERFPNKTEELIIKNRHKQKVPSVEIQKVLRMTVPPRIVTHQTYHLLHRPKTSKFNDYYFYY